MMRPVKLREFSDLAGRVIRPVDLTAFFDLSALPVKQLGLDRFLYHIQTALNKIPHIEHFHFSDGGGGGYRIQINVQNGFSYSHFPLQPGCTLVGRMDLFFSSDCDVRPHVSGGQDVCAMVARQICNYFDSVEFRTYMSRMAILQLDCSMDDHYDNSNPIHRYFFDQLVMRDYCSYLEPVDECFNVPN